MGCSSSKSTGVAAASVYRPPPSSFAVFDITSIEEPWLKDSDSTTHPNTRTSLDINNKHHSQSQSQLPPPILEKLKTLDDAPRSWDEVSKALEDLKPNLHSLPPPDPASHPNPGRVLSPPKNPITKTSSYHTLEELESKIKPKSNDSSRVDSPELKRVGSKTKIDANPAPVTVARSLKDNMFIMRDREERENAGKTAGFVRRDPLGDFEEKCPPRGEEAVVIYTTSLGGVRRTYEDCNKVRQLLENHQVVFDERDVALDSGFLAELREMVREGAAVPRMFVKGRYIGGVEEVVGLNETGRLSRILNWARVERGLGRLGCRGCGGARFVPCLGCGGSRKIVTGNEMGRCGECNENGLLHCPLCA